MDVRYLILIPKIRTKMNIIETQILIWNGFSTTKLKHLGVKVKSYTFVKTIKKKNLERLKAKYSP